MINAFSGDYRWLSNFEEASVFFEGRAYKSTEHAYQAAKSLNPMVRKDIAECTTCGRAKT